MERTLAPDASEDMVIAALSEWLSQYQPCLFGRIAAKQRLIHYRLLREEDLLASDYVVSDKIRQARLGWIRRGWKGEASSFLIAELSPRLAIAIPGAPVQEIARRLCALYLMREIQMDQIYLDEIFLARATGQTTTVLEMGRWSQLLLRASRQTPVARPSHLPRQLADSRHADDNRRGAELAGLE